MVLPTLRSNSGTLRALTTYHIGVDEAGRGPLAGHMTVAAAVIRRGMVLPGVSDSKKLTEKARERVFPDLLMRLPFWGVRYVSPQDIDRMGLQKCWEEAVLAVILVARRFFPDATVLLDGNVTPPGVVDVECEPKADAHYAHVGAASILAKVFRDRLLLLHALPYPKFSFSKHKGYGTAQHLLELQQFGPTPLHRTSFAPVARHVR